MKYSYLVGCTFVLGALLLLFGSGLPDAHAASRYHGSGQAQYASTTEGSPDFDPSQIQGWRHEAPFQAAIAALGSTPVQNLSIPVLFGVAVSDLTKNFGDPRSGGRTHEGLDILAPRNTPVASPTDSVVLRTGTGASAGNYVYAAVPGGETFVYMHLNQPSTLQSGATLKRGDIIGYVGDTGNALGGPTHLHFEIRKDNIATDPYPRLTSVFTPEEVAAKMGTLVFAGEPEGNIDLALGSSGEGVATLQQFLILENKGSAARALAATGATGTFGPLTQAALIEYQTSANISPADGTYGASTRTHIMQSDSQVAAAASVSSTAAAPKVSSPTPAPSASVPTRDLELGMKGGDVVWLQNFLIQKNTGPAAAALTSATATGYFGAITRAALAEYQASVGISPAVGYFGPITRAKVQI